LVLLCDGLEGVCIVYGGYEYLIEHGA